ncbi:ABC transporter substrate-binding protein [uncultured Megasphaera sp.]|uniref:ABC transporter substrate-binding protein n=1 Tax=uncultured Megasphaera sp. TaxID=165188 RepID=UPI00265A72BF|nr:ABC transporter substrate-binding protein [uncultured Megasphaera sp.]
MNKKWISRCVAVGLAVMMTAAFAGCGGSKDSAGADGKSAKIGFITAYTGPGAAYGQAMKDGVDLAVEEINKDPNTKVKIDLKTYDTKLDKTEAINAMKKAIEQDKVLAIEGPMTTGEVMAAGPIAQQAKVVSFTTGGTGPDVTNIGDYIFRNAIPGKLAIPQTVEKAQKKLGFKKVAILYSNNNDQMVGESKIYQKVFADAGIEVVATETFADKDTDFSAQLTKIQAANPDVIAVAGLYQEGALIAKKAREMGMNQPIIGNNGFNSPEYIKQAGAAADGTMVATPWNPERKSEKTQNFRKAFVAKYGHEPDQFAAQAYDAMYIIHEAVEKSGTTTDRKKFRDTLAQIKDYDGITGKFSFDDHRDPSMDLDVLIIKDGKWTPLS